MGNISLDKFVWKEYMDGIPRESEQNSTTSYKNFIDEFKMAYTNLVEYYSIFLWISCVEWNFVQCMPEDSTEN